MSIKFAHIKNKLKRGGLSRPERLNAALPPESIDIDGRQTTDMLQFIYSYARQVNYYQHDPVNPQGDWMPFFQKSIPFQYATIATYDLEALEQQYQLLANSVVSRLTFASLNPLFDLLFALTDQIARWRKDLEQDEAGLKTTIDNLVDTNLRNWAGQLIGLANSGTKWGYRSPGFNQRQKEVFFGTSGVTSELFSVDRRIIVLRGSTKHRVLAAKDILEEIYRIFWKAIEATVLTAQDADRLEQSLNTALGNHLPHLGLLFSFFKLYEKVQGSLNNLSTSHLDFFYRKSLKLEELPHQIDQAHVIFELGKQVKEAILIEKGQRFKAGKDENGEDVFFSLAEDTIVNTATVWDLKTLFIDQKSDSSTIPDSLQGVYKAPIANSADGLGEAFAKDSPGSWSTVGKKKSKTLDLDADPVEKKPHPEATLGFVVASKVLFLREGERTIDLIIELDNDCLKESDQISVVRLDENGVVIENLNESSAIELFKLSFSTEEGWLQMDVQPEWRIIDGTPNKLSATIKLANDFPAVLYPGKDILEEDYGHQLPMIKAEFNQELAKHDDNTSSFYWELRQQTITKVEVEVTVCDVRQLIVQNDLSVLDPNKPFQPFGPLPKANSSKFYIGSEEIFCKDWDQIDIHLKWKDESGLATDYYSGYGVPIPSATSVEVDVDILAEQSWSNLASNILLFDSTGTRLSTCEEAVDIPHFLSLSNNLDEDKKACTLNESLTNGYTTDLQCGFMCLRLLGQDFLHDRYARAILKSVEGVVADPPSEDPVEIPNPPFTPEIESISLSYSAKDNTEDSAHFTHLHPWESTYEQLPLDGDNSPQHGDTLLPCFLDEGTLYIGLKEFQPGSIVPLYFELEPSTADPDLDKAIVCWEYLRGNTWHPLQQDIDVLSDTTNGLIQSGIVTIAVPRAISREGTTIMPADQHWIKARVLLRTGAIAETLLVSSKAAVLNFEAGNDNDLNRLATQLESGTISKAFGLVNGLKGASQPYPSFGGRAPEPAADFNLRVSEHLRHKGRAITINDYERLVLAEFPQVYRVKCLNHTLGRRGEQSDFETCPGFVTLVVIPDLTVVNASEILEPKLPAADLQAIKIFLQNKISPFIRLEVLNPIYQSIKVSGDIQFKAGRSENFYLKQLQKELQVFLAPWSGEANGTDISFGGSVYYSSVLHFIEKLDYVETVHQLSLLGTEIIDEDEETTVEVEVDVITAKEARSVLTSNQEHVLNAVDESAEIQNNQRGVGYDTILR